MKNKDKRADAGAPPRIPAANMASNDVYYSTPSEKVVNPTMKFQVDLYQHGKQFARKSGAIQPDVGDLSALEGHAESMARQEEEPAFDPEESLSDRMRQDEFNATQAALRRRGRRQTRRTTRCDAARTRSARLATRR